MRALALVALVALPSPLGCRKEPAPAKPEPVAAASSTPSAVPSASAKPKLAVVPCGELECRAFEDLPSAFEATLVDKPLVVAIGEAHAKKGFEWVDTSAKRFTQEVVPKLEGRVSDLLLELMAPAQGCEQAKKQTNEQLGKIAKNQAAEAPNEYVVLGKAAEKVSIKVSQLHPSCKQLKDIGTSKMPALTVLQTIQGLMAHDAAQVLDGKQGKKDEKMLVIYGGAFHTEPEPPEERAEFSFAAPVAKAAKGRYASLHLFVREYIDPTWEIWQWYPQFKPTEHADRWVLLHPKPQHWVLISPASKRKE